MSFPTLRCVLLGILFAALLSPLAEADVLYTTGFETFTANTSFYPHQGDDKIVGTDNWLGSTAASYGAGRSGVDSESVHGVVGLGNAGFLGGVYSFGVSYPGKSLNVRRPLVLTTPFYYAPVTNTREVVTVSALIGIKDSSSANFQRFRDDFELFIMNGATTGTGSGTVLAAIQFDNTTLNSQGAPQQLVFRTQSASGSTNLTYVSTGGYYLYDTMQQLSVRINFRTNKWSAFLDGIPLFNDLTFYTGSAPVNLGAVGFRMLFGTATASLITPTNYLCNSGDNYMLFDDLRVEAEDRPKVAFTSAVKKTPGSFALTWNAEAGYRYNVYGSTTMGSWSLLTPTPVTAIQTTDFTFTDTTVTGVTRKFYKLGPPLFP